MEQIEAAISSKPKRCVCSSATEHITKLRELSRLKDIEGVEKILRMVSDTKRVRILKLLLGTSPLCVCEISMALEMDQTLTSHHLSVLRTNGLVTAERKSRWAHYELVDRKKVNDLISAIEQLSVSVSGKEDVL